ncbi:hypothetical protein JSE7799_00329 [Jannaschia seosinensis]|uniref:Uncharacterized protein n=1 Tax=Jannaschia seosinensis TaxID=313367 RepID=A0A0M7B749_9RHOB|nr:hypothetical protein [Jannaschia seosinensis]CUH15895.1 hypothetical protein JSE7799_00329 [Jannaschia seosinensis]
MDRAGDLLAALSNWWAARPPIPVPAPPDPALLAVAAILVAGLGLTGLAVAGTERRLSWLSLVMLLAGLAILYWLAEAHRADLGPRAMPAAIGEILMGILR